MKSLFKALDVIEAISDTGEIGIRALSEKAGFPPATTHRIVAALMERGYLQKDEVSHKYALAPKILVLAESVRERTEVSLIARPYLKKMMQITGENANLCVRSGLNATYVDHVHSHKHNLRIFTRIGGMAPLYASGVGKVFLSCMDGRQLDQYLEEVPLQALTPNTITAPELLRKEVKKIRVLGFSVDDQEKELGVRCVASPLFNHKGQIEAAISISGAAQRITSKRVAKLGSIVKEMAQMISKKLGYVPGPSL